MVNQEKGQRRKKPVLALTVVINNSSNGSGGITRMTMIVVRTMVPMAKRCPQWFSDGDSCSKPLGIAEYRKTSRTFSSRLSWRNPVGIETDGVAMPGRKRNVQRGQQGQQV